jgi:hypothetical protein
MGLWPFWKHYIVTYVERTDLGKINLFSHKGLPFEYVRSHSRRRQEPSIGEDLCNLDKYLSTVLHKGTTREDRHQAIGTCSPAE